ncbi:MAG: cytochrome-c oxidase, cbb3-type subunit I [Bdellovibrionaceae bacterium]|nr:cytochrome-c oxidase, cbb3-type subunit I [Pseudobdellovibrionaceae bacterium]MDW8190194.1 cytochrome-c oxidase, cbb3-type subunit I [Pseudobdellovibrionaceae bacterium]
MQQEIRYDDRIVRQFLIAMVLWAGVAFLVGIWVALQLANWKFNFDLEWFTFGRLRPLHTNAAIFAFAGNAIFAGIYYSTQRLLKTRMASDFLSQFHFWGWQLIIVAAALTLPLGITQSKEYAELEWPIDIAITIVWVVFGVNLFWTIARRREKHLYVAIWFYIATVITVALLHVVNSIEIPVGLFKSYPIWAGIQDALVQWWYGHNAVAFFLTTPFLGLMYYFMPKAAQRPVYSYRLSIVHFWALVFIYIWSGPHHLLNSAMPDWAQTLGMIFSLMLWAPSWGGMINGLLTLRGAWDKLRTDPVIKFLVGSVTFYGMSTFEGPILSIKSVNALAHFNDWIIAHVHGGALGWNGFLSFGMLYYLLPRLWNTQLYSKKLAEYHFWFGLLGILIYYISMWSAGITQGLMWMAINDQGQLIYPDFVETVNRIIPLYWVRVIGGTLYMIGFLIMVYNMIKTIQNRGTLEDEKAMVPTFVSLEPSPQESTHRRLEGLGTAFSVLVFIAVFVGSVISIYPVLNIHRYVPVTVSVEPYSPLELLGRDIYIKEGCYVCHSQMVRHLDFDVIRFGNPSKVEESMYDRPFQWGSKRTGPDLARVGKKYPDLWHYRHMINPRDIVTDSLMPSYPWLAEKKAEYDQLPKRLRVMKSLGVPYSEETVEKATEIARKDAQAIAQSLRDQGVTDDNLAEKEIIPLIAYLQALGHKVKGNPNVSLSK